MAPGSVTLREPHTPTHKTNQMPDLPPSCHTHTHTHVRKIHSGDRLLPPCVCGAAGPLSQTNRGNPPCLALSITDHLTVPAHVGSCRPSPDLPGQAPSPRDLPNTHPHTHTHIHKSEAPWLQPGSPDAETDAGRKFEERFVSVCFS